MATAKSTKDERIYIRVTSDIRDDFDKAAEFRGLTRSGLLHSLIVNIIHQTKKEAPEIFKNVKNDLDDSPAITLDQAREDDSKKRGDNKE